MIGHFKKGAIYSFHAKNLQPLYKDGTRMVKILAGMPGDVVEVDQSWNTTVNGGRSSGRGSSSLVGCISMRASFTVSGHTDGRTLLAYGEEPIQFRSRYWGTVNDEQIIGRAYPPIRGLR